MKKLSEITKDFRVALRDAKMKFTNESALFWQEWEKEHGHLPMKHRLNEYVLATVQWLNYLLEDLTGYYESAENDEKGYTVDNLRVQLRSMEFDRTMELLNAAEAEILKNKDIMEKRNEELKQDYDAVMRMSQKLVFDNRMLKDRLLAISKERDEAIQKLEVQQENIRATNETLDMLEKKYKELKTNKPSQC